MWLELPVRKKHSSQCPQTALAEKWNDFDLTRRVTLLDTFSVPLWSLVFPDAYLKIILIICQAFVWPSAVCKVLLYMCFPFMCPTVFCWLYTIKLCSLAWENEIWVGLGSVVDIANNKIRKGSPETMWLGFQGQWHQNSSAGGCELYF